jgi:hypothetical protein
LLPLLLPSHPLLPWWLRTCPPTLQKEASSPHKYLHEFAWWRGVRKLNKRKVTGLNCWRGQPKALFQPQSPSVNPPQISLEMMNCSGLHIHIWFSAPRQA